MTNPPINRCRSIEVVAHVYDPPGLDIYRHHMRQQFYSFCHHRPTANLLYTVMTEPCCVLPFSDRLFAIWQGTGKPAGIRFQVIGLRHAELFRRAIGRNQRATQTEADVILFGDADVYFADRAIDSICQETDRRTPLRYPDGWFCQKHPAMGDEWLEELRQREFPRPIDTRQFKYKPLGRVAVGSCQIVGHDVARDRGYLDGTSWVDPVDPTPGWRQTACDRAFRKRFGRLGEPISIPNLYHLRHSQEGRDRDQHGNLLSWYAKRRL